MRNQIQNLICSWVSYNHQATCFFANRWTLSMHSHTIMAPSGQGRNQWWVWRGAPPSIRGAPSKLFFIFIFLSWIHCEEKLKLSTSGNKLLLKIILDPPLHPASPPQAAHYWGPGPPRVCWALLLLFGPMVMLLKSFRNYSFGILCSGSKSKYMSCSECW